MSNGKSRSPIEMPKDTMLVQMTVGSNWFQHCFDYYLIFSFDRNITECFLNI